MMKIDMLKGSYLTAEDCYGELSSCSHSCYDINVFPVARYPNNSGIIEFSPTDKKDSFIFVAFLIGDVSDVVRPPVIPPTSVPTTSPAV